MPVPILRAPGRIFLAALARLNVLRYRQRRPVSLVAVAPVSSDAANRFDLKYSLSDPRWGRGSGQDEQQPQGQDNNRRPNDGPPDLDQLWRDFNQRLNRLFGGRNQQGGGGNGGGNFKPDAR
ncbi:MAG: protease modulator HflK N-terminal domain-containing protein, partial [Noviherbaspirillum sp.]